MEIPLKRTWQARAAVPALSFPMSNTITAGGGARASAAATRRVSWADIRITRRGVQVALGLIWLLDGVLQFQTYFYTQPFLTQFIAGNESGQPRLIAHSINWAIHVASPHLTQYDTLFGFIQVVIGLGLLFPPAVKPALALSFCWTPIVWWFGEGFGMIPAGMAAPLTGAPGAVLIYAMIGILVWPSKRPDRSVADGSPVGERVGLVFWSLLWLLAAALWLEGDNRAPNAFSGNVAAQEPLSMRWLASLQGSVAKAANGHGLLLAIVLSIVSIAVAAGVWTRLRPVALWIGIVISVAYWLLGQGMGELNTTQATDVNAGPLFVLLALTLLPRGATRPLEATGPSVSRETEPPIPTSAESGSAHFTSG